MPLKILDETCQTQGVLSGHVFNHRKIVWKKIYEMDERLMNNEK